MCVYILLSMFDERIHLSAINLKYVHHVETLGNVFIT